MKLTSICTQRNILGGHDIVKDNEISDLRYTDYYMTSSEKTEWDKHDIIYNSIWFYLKKGYDVEYGDKAIESYQLLTPYKDLQYVYHGTNGKVLIIDNQPFNSDIMTGWWNPFRYCFIKDNQKSRKDLSEELWKEIQTKENVIDWLSEHRKNKNYADMSDVDEAILAKEFIEFLKVIYSEGNIIPAPKNWSGGGLDSWCYKLISIYGNDRTQQAKLWRIYRDNYNGDFINDHALSMYFNKDDKEPIDLTCIWGDSIPDSFEGATNKHWYNYFKNMREMIVKRNKEIKKKR